MADIAVARTITAYTDQVAAIRLRVAGFIDRVWGTLADYRDAAIDRFVAAVVPIVAGGQLRVAALTDAYLAQLEAVVLGQPVRPVGVPAALVSADALRGVPAAEVYGRVGVTVWTALSNGDGVADAAAKGLQRAHSLAATDLQLAKTHASRHVLDTKDHVVGYRRVLEGGHNCLLCTTASRQRYHKGALMPIHPHCDCSVEPIFSADPGRDVGQTAAAAADVVVHEHGELGPVLAVRGQEFTGPHDI